MWQSRRRRMDILNDTKMWRNYKNFYNSNFFVIFWYVTNAIIESMNCYIYIYYHIWLIYASVGRARSTTGPRWKTNQWVDWTIVDWWVDFISFFFHLTKAKLWYGVHWMNVGPGARWSCSGHQRTSVGVILSPPFSYSIHLQLHSWSTRVMK